MPFNYDINAIFAELERQIRDKKEFLENPEDAKKTDIVAEPTSKTSEETHGGDEKTGEIEDSPNPFKNGKDRKNEENKEKAEAENDENMSNNQENDKKQQEHEKEEENMNSDDGMQGGGSGMQDEERSFSKDENSGKQGKGDGSEEEENNERSETDTFITNSGHNPGLKKPRTTHEGYEKKIDELFAKKEEAIEDFKKSHEMEYIKKYILQIIKKIASEHEGIEKVDGADSYDKKRMAIHIAKGQRHKILGDKYDLKDARYVQFFIDTSGVYGESSNRELQKIIVEVIDIIERQGYECHIAACGNGFYERDMEDDKYYNTRDTLESYNCGIVSKTACPTIETAAKMANEAEFSIIFADFDGLSSICEMADLCDKEKVPYFLCTEDRFSWDDPTYHEWVDPDSCYYDPNLVYDISLRGNPTLEEFENKNYYDKDYDFDDSYEHDD